MARISVLLFAVSVSLVACGGEVSVLAPEEHDSSPDAHPDSEEVSPGADSSATDTLPAKDGANAPDAVPAHDAPEETVSELEAEPPADVELDSSVATDSAADGAQPDSTGEADAAPGFDVESDDATGVDSESSDGDADSGPPCLDDPPPGFTPVCPESSCTSCAAQDQPPCSQVCAVQACFHCDAGEWRVRSVVCDPGCFDAGADASELDAGQMDACVPPGCIAVVCSDGFEKLLLECGDCADNDGDGLIDMADPDCTGPCDFFESDLGPPPGSPSTPCPQDCYYDLTFGSGDDTCHWDHRCGPLSKLVPALPYPYCKYKPELEQQCQLWLSEQSAICHDACEPITPNGCDCFGCCEHPAGSGNFLWLGSFSFESDSQQCRMAVIDDPFYCHPCTPVPSCMNPCVGCELCFGMTALPPGCDQQQCPSGSQPCGLPCQPLCPATQFCLTGCCTSLPSL